MSTYFPKKSNLQVDQLRDVAPHLLSGIIRYHQTIMLQSNNVWHHDYLFKSSYLLSALFTLPYSILKVKADMFFTSCFSCTVRPSSFPSIQHPVLLVLDFNRHLPIVRVRIFTLQFPKAARFMGFPVPFQLVFTYSTTAHLFYIIPFQKCQYLFYQLLSV